MKRDEFIALPGLIRRKDFIRLSGLNNRDLRVLIAQGKIRVWRRPVRVYHRNGRLYEPQESHGLYFKADLTQFVTIDD